MNFYIIFFAYVGGKLLDEISLSTSENSSCSRCHVVPQVRAPTSSRRPVTHDRTWVAHSVFLGYDLPVSNMCRHREVSGVGRMLKFSSSSATLFWCSRGVTPSRYYLIPRTKHHLSNRMKMPTFQSPFQPPGAN